MGANENKETDQSFLETLRSIPVDIGSAPPLPKGNPTWLRELYPEGSIPELVLYDKDLWEETRSPIVLTGVQLVELSAVSVEGQDFDRAVRARLFAATDYEWEAAFVVNNNKPISKGDSLLIEVHARAKQPLLNEEHGWLAVTFQQVAAPGVPSFYNVLKVPTEWTRYRFPFVPAHDYDVGEVRVLLAFGTHSPQTLEIGGLHVLNYKDSKPVTELPVTVADYEGRAADADWRAPALARIEKHRKGQLKFELSEEEREAWQGAKVRVEQTQHAFKFGIDVNPVRFLDKKEPRYREAVLSLFNTAAFNYATNWGLYEGTETLKAFEQATEPLITAVEQLKKAGFYTLGRMIVPYYKGVAPEYLVEKYTLENTSFNADLEAFQARMLERFGKNIDNWSVFTLPFFYTRFIQLSGHKQFPRWFELTRELAPHAELALQHAWIFRDGSRDTVQKQTLDKAIQTVQAAGAPLNALTLEAPIGWDMPAIEEVYAMLERVGAYDLPIYITQYRHNIANPEFQEDYLRDFYTLCFSHPAVEGIAHGTLFVGDDDMDLAALYDREGNPTASGKALQRLLDSWTTRASGTLDAHGQFETEGFYGTYQITLEKDGKTKKYTVQLTP